MTTVTPPNPAAPLVAVCQALGVPLRDRYPLGELAALLDRAGYACDPDLLAHLTALGRVPAPAADGWDVAGASAVLVYLDLCRCWRPGSPHHAHRKTRWRLEREGYRAAGRHIPDVANHGAAFLALLLAANPDPGQREALVEVLLDKLEQLGVDAHA